MAAEIPWERCEPNDPKRCQANGGRGQCPFKSVEGQQYCQRHMGAVHTTRTELRKYNIAKYQEKLNFQSDHPKIKDLSEEIGLIRLLLETKLRACEDDTMLLMHAGPIAHLAEKAMLLVREWHKIQMQTNVVMDRSQAMDFVIAISDIIAKEIQDTTVLKRISDQMIQELDARTNYGLRESKAS